MVVVVMIYKPGKNDMLQKLQRWVRSLHMSTGNVKQYWWLVYKNIQFKGQHVKKRYL